jgi:hypothetical protein
MRTNVCEEIIAARRCGKVRCGITPKRIESVADLAAAFGLLAEADYYREIDAATAQVILARLVGRDMAYGVEVVPADRASELAARFLAQFGSGSRFFTNGDWHRDDPAEWEAVTEATFDGGVLALGGRRSGCLWVEDED